MEQSTAFCSGYMVTKHAGVDKNILHSLCRSMFIRSGYFYNASSSPQALEEIVATACV